MFTLFHSPTVLELIRGPVAHPAAGLSPLELVIDRYGLAKRRWRGRASDGREFGFDLRLPLRHGDVFHESSTHCYVVAQTPEAVLRIEMISLTRAARVAWNIGNLHFPVMISHGYLLAEDDPAVRQMLEREDILFVTATVVFEPQAGLAGHHHH